MNKSLALKNKLYLFFLLLVSLFIFIYLIYFLVNGNRGIISFFKISKENSIYKNQLISLNKKNKYLEGRIKRLKTNSLDLDFLDEKIREKTGYIYEDEIVIIFK
tara:strand:+ start:204 stop:515 length:312 start_codon:yes stop_codon:yes gene_type:complete